MENAISQVYGKRYPKSLGEHLADAVSYAGPPEIRLPHPRVQIDRDRYRHILTKRNRPAILQQLIERDGSSCRYCGIHCESEDNLTIEHLIPKSRGGSNHLKNLAITCKACNNHKGSLDDDEYRQFRTGNLYANCHHCGAEIRPEHSFCKGHYIHKRVTPIYAQLLADLTPEQRGIITGRQY